MTLIVVASIARAGRLSLAAEVSESEVLM